MKFGLVEYFRFLAALGIIAWHIPGLSAGLVTWSLPFFVVLSMIFARTAPDPILGARVRRHASHFLVPWVVWSIIYLILRTIRHATDLGELLSEFSWRDIMVGGVLPLWYLPFIFLCLLACTSVQWSLERTGPGKLVSLCRRPLLLGLIVLSVPLAVILQGSGSIPFLQYSTVIPAVFLGLLYRVELGRDGKGPSTGIFWCGLGLGLLIVTSILADWRWEPTAFAFLLVGISVGRWPTQSRLPIFLGAASWPIYLVHPMFIGLLYGSEGPRLDGMNLITVFVLVAFCSIVVSALILQWPLARGLLLEGKMPQRKRAT